MPTILRRNSKPANVLEQLVGVTTIASPLPNGAHKPTPGQTCSDCTEKIKNRVEAPTHVVVDACKRCEARQDEGMNGHGAPEHATNGVKVPAIKDHIRRHLTRVYDEARGRHEKLSREDFIEFLKNTHCEGSVHSLEQDEYAEGEFLREWYSKYGWDALRPLRPDEKDLSKPISNYLINSSHNTYLVGNQLTSASSVKVYKKVLERHCRCIEIDVWDGDVSGTSTPGHHRHLSSSSIQSTLPRAAAETYASLRDKIEDLQGRAAKISSPTPVCEGNSETVKRLIPGLHTRHESLSKLIPSIPSQEGSESPAPSVVDTPSGRPRMRSKASTHSFNKNEPIVMHGYTLTAPVGFRDVCRMIKESAFSDENDLPIIVSLEVHANLDQQEVMVDIMKEEWDELLLASPFDECKPGSRQPSLQELRRKILIKVKRSPSKVIVPPDNNAHLMPPGAMEDDGYTSESAIEVAEKDAGTTAKGKKPPVVPICESLGALAIYTHSERFHDDFNGPEAKTHSHIFSVAESRIIELHQSEKKANLQAHNRRFFMRAFPDSKRFMSDNMDPSRFWGKGVQMVAMNWQRWDERMALNDAMFTPDTCGWVLKPPGYRSDDTTAAISHGTLDMHITVYAGQHIPLLETSEDAPLPLVLGGSGAEKRFRPRVKVELVLEKVESTREEKWVGSKQFPRPKAIEEERAPTPKLEQAERFSSPALGSGEKFSTPKLGFHENWSTPSLISEKRSARSGDAAAVRSGKDAQYKRETPVGKTTHPDWGRDGFEMDFIDIPNVVESLSFVRFKVEDDSRKKAAAWACVRLDRLLPGYRFVDLLDCKGNPSDGKLFVRVDKVVR